jgi:glycosyltransferase involved in cell wall biosynthesis
MKIQVITPTIGTKFLQKAIDSVHDQTIPVQHLIVLDGAVDMNIKLYDNDHIISLPDNIGHSGWNGHRVYAAMPLMSDADYILYLDEDNWFEPDHVEKMINYIKEHDLTWCYSLRNIVDQEGKFIAQDNCESLGDWPPAFGLGRKFVDTNCYCFKRKYLAQVSHHFYGKDFLQDRIFYDGVMDNLPDYECTGEYSVNYRIREHMKPAFERGNQITKAHYKGEYPWAKK